MYEIPEQYKLGYHDGFIEGYNSAIDDLYDTYYPREICKQIKEIAQQLKIKRE